MLQDDLRQAVSAISVYRSDPQYEYLNDRLDKLLCGLLAMLMEANFNNIANESNVFYQALNRGDASEYGQLNEELAQIHETQNAEILLLETMGFKEQLEVKIVSHKRICKKFCRGNGRLRKLKRYILRLIGPYLSI